MIKDMVRLICRTAANIDAKTCCKVRSLCKWIYNDYVIKDLYQKYRWEPFVEKGHIDQWIMDQFGGELHLKNEGDYHYIENIKGCIRILNSNITLRMNSHIHRGIPNTEGVIVIGDGGKKHLLNIVISGARSCMQPQGEIVVPYTIDVDALSLNLDHIPGIFIQNASHIYIRNIHIHEDHEKSSNKKEKAKNTDVIIDSKTLSRGVYRAQQKKRYSENRQNRRGARLKYQKWQSRPQKYKQNRR